MQTFDEMIRRNHEQVLVGYDKEAGLKAIIAIHNTTLGPAPGGTRMWKYSTEEDALKDVIRLSRGMRVAVQGVGHVGQYLCEFLHKEGAKLIISDIDKDVLENVAQKCEAQIVNPDEIYDVEAEIFAPCALGAIINTKQSPGSSSKPLQEQLTTNCSVNRIMGRC